MSFLNIVLLLSGFGVAGYSGIRWLSLMANGGGINFWPVTGFIGIIMILIGLYGKGGLGGYDSGGGPSGGGGEEYYHPTVRQVFECQSSGGATGGDCHQELAPHSRPTPEVDTRVKRWQPQEVPNRVPTEWQPKPGTPKPWENQPIEVPNWPVREPSRRGK